MAKVTGAMLMARSLKQQGVEFMYGIVGFPVQPIAAAAQEVGIKYIGMRNEQSASYAAQAAGYLTGRPGACLTVSGPGVVHGLAGLANAQQNCWPMILIGGAAPTYQNGMGSFQEENQVQIASPFCKFAHAVEHVERIPFYVEKAVRQSIYGRPGATYLDMPDDIIQGEVEEDDVQTFATVPEPPRMAAVAENVTAALDAMESAERPLVIVGKGMAWSRAENEVRAFIERTQLPFLASPMGKGVLDDNHPLSVGAARSHALKEADVIFVMGARLNWIMHYGLPPRFKKDVRVVQLDISPEAIGDNVPTEVALVGDGKTIVGQLNTELENRQWFYPADTDWKAAIAEKAAGNAAAIQPMIDDNSTPTNYYRALKDISAWATEDAVIIGEGANTMDIGRTQLPNASPRLRLDAGTYGTMGIGMGFAIAAATVHPERPIISVSGDSAIGFSGMEIETACRHKLPIKIVVLNNGGIGQGIAEFPTDAQIPPGILTIGARYDLMMEAFGGKGFLVNDPADLAGVLEEAKAFDGPTLVNVILHPQAGRKPQQFGWLTT
ncbi:MAG: oxalyl-CoA decarboxylase [Rhodospirillaceae bacterium]|nr:oxalyl-CoA decarboxylase [Rhodospirillaceae bacterium]MBT6588992.1 oxalyl-CoA decarboxylase [Rhodospirillaceae bacterium]MBT6985656.1 oxalyl-CoA decarboxylase [Rhodospirillaceae bacterium]MBT7979403.1 oxalyl-CoA decarboxylase [Rhodospirillaceae bacterium]